MVDYKSLALGVLVGIGFGVAASATFYKEKARKECEEIRDIHQELLNIERGKTQTAPLEEIVRRLDAEEALAKLAVYQGKPDDLNLIPDYEHKPSEAEGKTDEELPYVISEEEFSEECLDYDKDFVRFFLVDKTLVDSSDIVIEDQEATLGRHFMEALPEDSNCIGYIRDDESHTDYEVEFVDGSYLSQVLGIGEE